MLTEGALWWTAFLTMVSDFEIFTDLPRAQFERRVRRIFDIWSGGNGMMPGKETANALLELTNSGIWLSTVQRLLTNLEICGVLASGSKKEMLEYSDFKSKWQAVAAGTGFIEKARIRSFITDLIVDSDTKQPRGMWYEAFCVALQRLSMTLKTSTQLVLFNEADKAKRGFLDIEQFGDLLQTICERGIWQSAYIQFLELNQIDLPEQVTTKYWNYLNEGEPNPGLVPISKLCDELEAMIMTSGLLPSILATSCSLMGISVASVELHFLHSKFDYNANGFMAFEDMYALLDSVGRRGLPYESFQRTVVQLGFTFGHRELYEVFSSLDLDQDGQLNWAEFRGGMEMIVKEKLPQSILVRIGMSDTQMAQRVVGVVVGMMGGKSVIATIQSTFATGITFGAKSESSGGLDLDKYRAVVAAMIAGAMGMQYVPKLDAK
eukprot:gnl/TRDRNA2_/TRDRNA2_156136_c0_seq2.p1 gnl/TRDRNA2_/TRDRNA2_156136_c0~~gnl/TRDRNA2_/TRDRNA2_156136_c0_seq2.p1  ORF type:complete len:508 (-),score=118.80 gnl/TRDRNA2_/TRDRNA2_156136_c0_seq2:9-1313(-)